MKLDVVVPTYNRRMLLFSAINSLLRAPVPEGLERRIIVVDNNSKDDTAEMVRHFQSVTNARIDYVLETKQGSSAARNAGIAAGDGDLIGFIDDDEEIDQNWYAVIQREFRDPETQFIGGPYLPNWAKPAPPWLPPGYHAAIGAIPPKPRGVFGQDCQGNLMGGNAVLRRTVFERVGTYALHLGRSNKGLLSEEDAEFCRRLDAASIRGVYVPDLLIHHYIPPERLTRHYHRRWVFWRAVSQGSLSREQPEAVAHLFGIPRYMFGRALRAPFALLKFLLTRRNHAQAFKSELAFWDLIGFAYGRHIANLGKFYEEGKPLTALPKSDPQDAQ